MTRPVLIPYRWIGHGLDLRVYFVHGTEPLFAAPDVAKAIDIHVLEFHDAFWDTWSYTYPLPTQQVDGCPVDLFTADQVRRLAADKPMFLDADGPTWDFLEWFDELVETLTGPQVERIVAAATPSTEAKLTDRSFSVGRAARILSGDPTINLGEKSLFEAMQNLGWIDRDLTYTWIPDADFLTAGFLLKKPVRVPGRKTLYPQIRISDAGMHELHRKLGGIADLALDAPAHLTLVEIP